MSERHYLKSERIRYQILKYLIDNPKGISGADLSHLLGINRSAISKQINALEQWGVSIHSISSAGYFLNHSMTLLDIDFISNELLPYSVEFHPVINSTNTYMVEHLSQWEVGTVCLGEFQTQGKGRRGKEWITPFGSQLFFSIYWRIEQGVAATMGLSLAVGLSIAKTLRRVTKQPVQLKWPNDLYLNQKKIAGILVEIQGNIGEPAHLVIGAGINLTVPLDLEYHNIIGQAWGNLFDEADQINRNQLTVDVLKDLHKTLDIYSRVGLTSEQLDDWRSLDLFINKPVKLISAHNEISGIDLGIDPQGALLLKLNDGSIQTFTGGEISLRGSF